MFRTKMRKQLTIMLFGIMTLMAYAQTSPALMPTGSESCEFMRSILMAPYYYCDCKENSNTFAFPLEREISDTLWYDAKKEDMMQGITAYWFADCSLTMEIYALCSSTEPTLSIRIGKNQMQDIDINYIRQIAEEVGEAAQEILNMITPHIRIYPNKGGKGTAYCYPYDQGPHSTCENTLPLYKQLTYVCDQEENVYRLDPKAIDEQGQMLA